MEDNKYIWSTKTVNHVNYEEVNPGLAKKK